MTCKLFTNLLDYTFISFDGRNRICLCKSTNDYACTGEHYSLFVVRHVGTNTARRARHDRLDALDTFETGRDEPRVSFGLMK